MMAHAKSRQHPTGYWLQAEGFRIQDPGPPQRKWCKKRIGNGCRNGGRGLGEIRKKSGCEEDGDAKKRAR